MKGKRIFETAVLILAMLVLYAVLLVSCENKIIYHPHKYPDGEWNTENAGLQVEDVWFSASDGVKLHGWYFPNPDAQATLLFFHGNAGNLSHRLDNIRDLVPLGLNVFIFDYRGYGRSEGSPDEPGILLDAQAAYDILIQTRNATPERLILFGRSLGGVFAAHTARHNACAGLILEATFTDARDMANKMVPFLPIGFALRSKLDAVNQVPHITVPKLFLHGTVDEIIPYRLGRKLYDAAAQPKEFYDIEGAGHNDTTHVGGAPYYAKLQSFISTTVNKARSQTGPS